MTISVLWSVAFTLSTARTWKAMYACILHISFIERCTRWKLKQRNSTLLLPFLRLSHYFTQHGRPWSARHWMGSVGLEQQKEQRWLATEPPPPQGLSHHLCPQPPLCQAPSGGMFMGRGCWGQPPGGFAGLKHLGLVAHCWRGQGCSSSPCLS